MRLSVVNRLAGTSQKLLEHDNAHSWPVYTVRPAISTDSSDGYSAEEFYAVWHQHTPEPWVWMVGEAYEIMGSLCL